MGGCGSANGLGRQELTEAVPHLLISSSPHLLISSSPHPHYRPKFSCPMSTSFVSCTNSTPITSVMTAMAIGYQSPE